VGPPHFLITLLAGSITQSSVYHYFWSSENVAIIALFTNLQKSDNHYMEKVDANWIRARLTGEHGEQQRLAEAMGINGDKLSKILKGKRRVQASEVPGAIAFFQNPKREPSDPQWQDLRNLWSELTPEEREFLRNSAKAQIDARHRSQQTTREDEA